MTVCGWCGGPLVGQRQRKYCSPHHALLANRHTAHGAANNRYNGGLCRRGDGRWVIHCRDHSLKLYARAVMEGHLARHLESHEIVHHVNGDVADDRIENLQLVTRAEHRQIHHEEIREGRWGRGRRAA